LGNVLRDRNMTGLVDLSVTCPFHLLFHAPRDKKNAASSMLLY
jgi:hypothetical protein